MATIPDTAAADRGSAAGEARARTRARVERGELGIGELCERTGLSARTVRYYEEIGLLPDVRRSSGGRRVYGDDALERLRFIGRLKTLGLSLGEIRELNELYALAGSTHAMLRRLHALLGDHLDELDGRIESLTTLRDEMQGYREHVSSRLAGEVSVLGVDEAGKSNTGENGAHRNARREKRGEGST